MKKLSQDAFDRLVAGKMNTIRKLFENQGFEIISFDITFHTIKQSIPNEAIGASSN